jgi:glycosyltransferase involved in cell wall biosynthesis
VQDRWPEARLTLVGGGPEETRLRALATELRLEHVAFTGRVSPVDIARLYDDHDIYVQSPDIDNMPTSVIEAYASGLPVVSTEAGGVPAILTDEVHGFLVPVNDHEGLAARVTQLLDDPDRARRMARQAYETVRSCTWTAVREQWLDAYRRAIRSTRASASIASAARADSPIERESSIERTA